jgi:8-oxo-dGTP pyrophosphatase MutT (NUDIX family)
MGRMKPPINKVGVCVVLQHPEHAPEILLVQPTGKQQDPNDPPPFVLPRGTRAYMAEDGQWHDARSEAEAIAHADALEPLDDTMKREAQEEAGIPPALFATRPYHSIGARIYHSPSKPSYPIHWGALILQPEDLGQLTPPKDSQALQWVTIEQFAAMAAQGAARAGYVAIAREALAWASEYGAAGER